MTVVNLDASCQAKQQQHKAGSTNQASKAFSTNHNSLLSHAVIPVKLIKVASWEKCMATAKLLAT